MSAGITSREAITALRHRARTGIAIAALTDARDGESQVAHWQAVALALRMLERGTGAALARKDASLAGYEPPRVLAAALQILGEDVELLTRRDIQERVAQAGIQLPLDDVPGGYIATARELEDGVLASVDPDAEHSPAHAHVLDDASSHRSRVAIALEATAAGAGVLVSGTFAAGNVLAECTGNGQHSDDAVRVAAEIERRVNTHDELLSLVIRGEAWLSEVESAEIAAAKRPEHSQYLLDLRAAIAKTTGGAA
jgi:hypothetical protein